MGRKVYNRQFKMAAVQLVMEENLFVKEVAKELSIHPNTLYRWISQYEEYRLIYTHLSASILYICMSLFSF
ncbi:transposase [Priestia megaterium]|jgi:transposase-like protein|uniref:transposase n=1 Tax=Priestia TaxID=2800373 RepID=UPI000BF87A18|nr:MULTISPECIES: transposase [Priestia]MCR8866055.1 transposase [Priestia megaterium]MDC7783593.1 transposase [Priestia megaterium]MDN3232972.1 transposase [Priestia megaterium]MDR7206570.1 transposase-like protein [Priestia megaterium]MED3861024.1 transposase [Priestia megaterium]